MHLGFSPHPQPAGHTPGDGVLRNYRIGLGAIGLFTLALALAVVVMAGGAKQDAKTQKSATGAASTLENYVSDNQQIPDSLAQAGVKNAPAAISYKKLSNSSYQFCVTYKSASNGAGNAVTDVVDRGISRAYGGGLSGSSTSSSYLYISADHKKGANCQKITPYIYSADSSSGTTGTSPSSSSSSSDTYVDPKAASTTAGSQDNGCGSTGSYATHYSGVISGITLGDDQSDDNVVLKITPNGSTPAGEQTVTITTSDNAFDSSCAAITASSFLEGDYVSVFQNNSNQFVYDMVINYTL